MFLPYSAGEGKQDTLCQKPIFVQKFIFSETWLKSTKDWIFAPKMDPILKIQITFHFWIENSNRLLSMVSSKTEFLDIKSCFDASVHQ